MKNQPYELLIFDWDGTLMDSKSHIVACLEHAIDSVGIAIDQEDDLSRVIGLGLREALTALLPDAKNETVDSACLAFRDKFLSAEKSPSQLFPDVESTLSDLRQAGYYLAIATGKSRAGLDKVLVESGLSDFFSITRCADETLSKPHPQMLEEILIDMNTEPANAIMIGDTEYDLQMANNFGIDSLGVSYGVHDAEHLAKFNPLAVLHNVKEVGNWVMRM